MSNANALPGNARALILTIHGTNDGKPGQRGDTKWWENSSGFTRDLAQLLAARGLTADVEPFLWGGANSAFTREKGSVALRRRISKAARTYDEIHLIGHSHGGNVALDAARRAAWGRVPRWRFLRGRPAGITSITTVGTPFLRPLARNSDYLYALAFVVLMLVATLGFAGLAAAGFWAVVQQADVNQNVALIAAGMGFALFMSSALLLARGIGRFLWIRRLMQRGARRANLLSIWHPKDEAIGVLKRAGAFSPELVPRWALWSSGHRAGTKLGSALFVLFGILIFPLASVLLVAGPQEIPFTGQKVQILNLTGDSSLNTALFIIFCLTAVCMLALGLYVLARLSFGALELLARSGLNARAVSVLRDFAFGSDTGQKLGEVSEIPHFFEGEVWTTPEDLAKKMEDETLSALTQFLARQRASLFSVTMGADWMREVGEDAATWDSLIHTTYFDHPEITGRISDHIAGTHNELNPEV